MQRYVLDKPTILSSYIDFPKTQSREILGEYATFLNTRLSPWCSHWTRKKRRLLVPSHYILVKIEVYILELSHQPYCVLI